MTRSQLVQMLSQRHGELEPDDVRMAVDTILSGIADSLAQGRRIELRGFGAFTVNQRPAREVRNPKTGARILVKPKALPRFKAGKALVKTERDGDRS